MEMGLLRSSYSHAEIPAPTRIGSSHELENQYRYFGISTFVQNLRLFTSVLNVPEHRRE